MVSQHLLYYLIACYNASSNKSRLRFRCDIMHPICKMFSGMESSESCPTPAGETKSHWPNKTHKTRGAAYTLGRLTRWEPGERSTFWNDQPRARNSRLLWFGLVHATCHTYEACALGSAGGAVKRSSVTTLLCTITVDPLEPGTNTSQASATAKQQNGETAHSDVDFPQHPLSTFP